MHKELLAQSPLLALPLIAMALFFLVWVVATIRAMTRPRAEMNAVASLPLVDDDQAVRRGQPGGDHE